MTARIGLLSPDIRRPGRAGDLIIPVLDPEGEDRAAFLRWMVEGTVEGDPAALAVELDAQVEAESAAAFAALRSSLKARAATLERKLTAEDVRAVVADFIPPAIDQTRRYQTLQALVNCTRRSLLPDPSVPPSQREQWQAEIRALEAVGVR